MLNANGWLAWLVELSPAIAWGLFLFGIGDGCCFSCDDNCCEGDNIPDQVEVTVPDVANVLSAQTSPGNGQPYFSSRCSACESIAGTYVLDRTDTGDDDNQYAWEYEEADFCETVVTYSFDLSPDVSCTFPLTLAIEVNTNCDVLAHGLCGMNCSVSLNDQTGTPCGVSLATYWGSGGGNFAYSWRTDANWGPLDCTTATWNMPVETWTAFSPGFRHCSADANQGSEVDVEAVVPP